MTAYVTAGDMLAPADDIQRACNAAELTPSSIEFGRTGVTVRLDTEAAVDRVAEQFTDAEADNGEGDIYQRTAFVHGAVTVRIYSLRTLARCRCGAVCEHRAVSA